MFTMYAYASINSLLTLTLVHMCYEKSTPRLKVHEDGVKLEYSLE